MEQLPPDVIVHVYDYLSPIERAHLCTISKQHSEYIITASQNAWKRLFPGKSIKEIWIIATYDISDYDVSKKTSLNAEIASIQSLEKKLSHLSACADIVQAIHQVPNILRDLHTAAKSTLSDYHLITRAKNKSILTVYNACSYGNIDTAKLSIVKSNGQYYNGAYYACQHGHDAIIDLFIDYGKSPNCVDGCEKLHHNIKNYITGTANMRLLVDHIAIVDTIKNPLINWVYDSNYPSEYPRVVKLLQKHHNITMVRPGESMDHVIVCHDSNKLPTNTHILCILLRKVFNVDHLWYNHQYIHSYPNDLVTASVWIFADYIPDDIIDNLNYTIIQ